MVALPSMRIHQIINQPVSSNCFILSQPASEICIIIDPGSTNNVKLENFLSSSRLNPEVVILTHEHFDHCAGVDALATLYNFRLIATEQTAVRIKSRKTNFSAYYEAVVPFEVQHPVDIVKDGEAIEHENYKIVCLEHLATLPEVCALLSATLFLPATFC